MSRNPITDDGKNLPPSGGLLSSFFFSLHLPVHTTRVTLTTEIVHTSQSLAASIPPPYPRIFYFQKNKQNTTGRAAHAKPPDSSSSQPKSHEQGRTHTHTSFLLFYILCWNSYSLSSQPPHHWIFIDGRIFFRNDGISLTKGGFQRMCMYRIQIMWYRHLKIIIFYLKGKWLIGLTVSIAHMISDFKILISPLFFYYFHLASVAYYHCCCLWLVCVPREMSPRSVIGSDRFHFFFFWQWWITATVSFDLFVSILLPSVCFYEKTKKRKRNKKYVALRKPKFQNRLLFTSRRIFPFFYSSRTCWQFCIILVCLLYCSFLYSDKKKNGQRGRAIDVCFTAQGYADMLEKTVEERRCRERQETWGAQTWKKKEEEWTRVRGEKSGNALK